MGTTRTNFYKNPSFAYNRDFNLSSALRNLKAYNIATGNASLNDEEPRPENKQNPRRKRSSRIPPPRERSTRVDESNGPMSHEDYIAKRRKEACPTPVCEELTPDILGASSSRVNLVGYASDGSDSEGEEKQGPSSPGHIGEGDRNGPEQDRVKIRDEQRFPDPGEPVCVMCGKYGEYICDETDDDICSLDCKSKLLETLNFKETPSMYHHPAIALPEHDCTPMVLEEEDTWDYERHCWLRKKSDLCTYNCSKCQKPGHLAEDCLVAAGQSKCSSIPRELVGLYRRCQQIGKNSKGARCNECQSSSGLATCLDCNITICDGAGHLNEHMMTHLSHRQYYSHKLKRLVKCSKSTCNVTDISELLACHCCFDKAFDKFYDMLTATWKAAGLAIIWGSVCCEDHFLWHRVNCPSAGMEENAYFVSRTSRKGKHIQLSEFIF
ncbi:uncharacterized protein LOC116189099 isoform X2 [Punica granatum]|uniref:Uncharacterized protein LOC116189099 isoform X2 n=1 Tax=Punica granatum TaxID=22663 RepID=A0A6P8BY25_PUNGR|nr:uncharacterized protein LOC116189099 isoform X2 [Punica granatum]